jgi:putative transposase
VLQFPRARSIKNVTVKQTPTGDWFATCVTEFVGQPVKPVEKACGIDLGLNDLAVITDGTTYEHIAPPKFFRRLEEQLAKAQKHLSRKVKGSKNAAKAKRVVAKLHRRIGNLRANWLHQLSSRLVSEHDLICLEDLSLKGMAKTNLAKSVLDAALGEFVRQLEYKSEWRGKATQKIGRFFPSSKLHMSCGVVNKELTLSDRIWTCACGEEINRDENASLNILFEGLNLSLGCDTAEAKQLLRMGESNVTISLHRPLTQESHAL